MKAMNTKDAIDFFGSQEALAEQLGIKQPSVAGWVKSGEVPPLRQLQLEVITGGSLKADKSILPKKKVKPQPAKVNVQLNTAQKAKPLPAPTGNGL
jgi:DNA-binding transcriptional regulator YdaS (Cro superfamily)